MAGSGGLPPLGLDRLQAERMFQHLLRTVLSVADAGEHIQGRCWSDVGPSGGTIIFAIDRPAALQSMDEAEIFDPGYGPDGEWPRSEEQQSDIQPIMRKSYSDIRLTTE